MEWPSVRCALLNAFSDNKTPQLALLSYRDTATEPTKESPARLLMGRRLRTTVTKLNHLLRPAWPDLTAVKRTDEKAKRAYERTYNRKYSAKPLPAVEVGDRVRLKTDIEKEWSQSGVVQATSSTPRSFVVKMPGGETVRRNRRQLQIVNQEADDTHIGMKSTSPDHSVVTHDVPVPAGCEPEAAVETHTPF